MRRGKIQPLYSQEEKKKKVSLGTFLCLQDLRRIELEQRERSVRVGCVDVRDGGGVGAM